MTTPGVQNAAPSITTKEISMTALVNDPSRTAVAYLRVSTTDQATRGGLAEGLSIPAQRRAIYAKAQAVGA